MECGVENAYLATLLGRGGQCLYASTNHFQQNAWWPQRYGDVIYITTLRRKKYITKLSYAKDLHSIRIYSARYVYFIKHAPLVLTFRNA